MNTKLIKPRYATPINSYIVYFRYAGERKYKLLSSLKEVKTFRSQLKKHRRKFLGTRFATFVEIDPTTAKDLV